MLDLHGCHVKDLKPLAGMPLTELYLEDTAVEDISPLKGMPLSKLYLSNTKVENLGPLDGAPWWNQPLGRQGDRLKPLARCQLQMVWLNKTPVKDIARWRPTRW